MNNSQEVMERYIEWHKHIKNKYDPYEARLYYSEESMFKNMQKSLGIHSRELQFARAIRKRYRVNSLDAQMAWRIRKNLRQ